MNFKKFRAALIYVLCSVSAYAYNYPDLKWEKTETQHFVIHFHQDEEFTAMKVAAIADKVYEDVTAVYKHHPKRKTHIYIRDDEDTSNGFAVFSLNMLTIWASPSQMRLRGQGDWIRGVLTHEFSHIVSLQAAAPSGWLIEGVRIGAVTNADTKENADLGASVFFPGTAYSRWWAEGTAQLDTEAAHEDPWDTHRDMLLRANVLDKNLLSFTEMRNISVRDHFGGEMVYNQGFAFLRWLKETYGPEINAVVAQKSAGALYFDFDSAIEAATGKPAATLYDEWRAYLQKNYETQVSPLQSQIREGALIKLVSDEKLKKEIPKDGFYLGGFSTSNVRFSPDGLWLSYIDEGKLRLKALPKPFSIPDPNYKDKDYVLPAAFSASYRAQYYAWSPDSKQIVVSRRTTDRLGGYPQHELYTLDLTKVSNERKTFLAKYAQALPEDLSTRKTLTQQHLKRMGSALPDYQQLTYKQRATHPAWSPNGEWIAFSSYSDGHRALKLFSLKDKSVKTVLDKGADTQAIDPTWAPTSDRIAYTWVNRRQADIWVTDLEGLHPEPVTLDKCDDRDPHFSADGNKIYFSSDRTGIFQIYAKELATKDQLTQLTQVITGAFMPFVDEKNMQLIYVRFSSYGFKPYKLPLPGAPSSNPPVTMTMDPPEKKEQQLLAETFPALSNRDSEWLTIRPPRIFPTLVYENSEFKAGLSLDLADYLEKHELILSALFGNERDLLATYFNRTLIPTFYVSYAGYLRNQTLPLFADGDAIADDAKVNLQSNIQFISAGISQDFRWSKFSRGTNVIGLEYNKRFVDRTLGVPLLINDELTSSFRLLTNDSLQASWRYSNQPQQIKADQDINPQDVMFTGLSYNYIHTRLLTPDTTISAPNRKYFHHDFQFYYKQYLSMPTDVGPFKHHTFWFGFNGGWKSRDVNSNDQYYLGGRLNFRAFGQITNQFQFYGYEDFSVSGETLLLASAGYTFPLARSINKKLGWLYVDSIYASIFGEAGNIWDHGEVRNSANGEYLLEDVGLEIKMKSFLFNDWNRFGSVIRVAYGFQDNAAHGFQDDDNPIRVYVGLGTDF